jgi:hypothetical protein
VERSHRSERDGSAERRWPEEREASAERSPVSYTKILGSIGFALGALFGLAVVLFADCAHPGCSYERVIGVAGHAAGGGAIGALAGLAIDGVRRL